MKRSIGVFQLTGFAATSLIGTILHFLYDWLGEAVWIAPFSSVNESTWEHMKLLFWPMFLYAIIESFFFRDRTEFWCIKLKGILLGIVSIPIILIKHPLNGLGRIIKRWWFLKKIILAAVLAEGLFCTAKICKEKQ